MKLKRLIPARLRDSLRKRAKYYTFDHTFPRAYRKASTAPVNDRKAVFVELNRDFVSDSMELALEEMRSRGFDCEFISLHAYCGDFMEYTACCKRMVQSVATARYVFICEACMPIACLPLREETKVIQLWHGCGAFKRFGMSTADKIFGASREEKLRYPAHRNTSLVTVSSPEVVWAYVEAMSFEDNPQVVQPLGVSRTDVFFSSNHVASLVDEVKTKVPQVGDRKILLYAPTFRGRVATATAPDALDIECLQRRLGTKWALLIKHHPHVKRRPPIPETCRDFAFDVSDGLSIEACMCAADACLSDYSSLVFEYSLFRRPMAFFAYDLDDYDDWRGFYYPYEEMTPGPVLTDTEGVVCWAEGLEDGFDAAEVEAFRQRFMSSCDGHATERIISTVLGEQQHAW